MAKYKGKSVRLNKPSYIQKGQPGYGRKKRQVYTKGPSGRIVRVMFGDPNMKIRKSNPSAKKSFRSRHRCSTPGPKYKARYWACKTW
tara:strand:+ start:329 stop:589 length:261 start_codon:yes stop_codon:yes gene_type:complete